MEETEVTELTEAQELAAMTAGFTGTDAEPEPQEDTTAQPQEEEAEPEVTAEPEVPKALTLDDLNAAVERALQGERTERQKLHDRLYGKIGELQQKITSAKTAATGLSPKAREKMEKEFPELAQMLWDDEVQAEQPMALPQIDFNEVLTQRVNETQQQFEKRLLKRDHPDWEQVIVEPDFATWRDSICTPEDAATLAETWDADFISAKLNEYKGWKTAQQTHQVSEQQRRTVEAQKAKERLEAAVVPSGKPRVQSTDIDDEEAAMLAAFGTPRNRR